MNVAPDLRLGRWEDVLADVADATVRLILTSPPYDDARSYEGTCSPVAWDVLAAFALRVLVPGGTLAMVLDGQVVDGRLSTTPYDVATAWARLDGWRFAQVLAYGRQGLPGEYRGRFRRDHEPLFVFHKLGGAVVCEKERVAETARNVPGSATERLRDGTLRAGGFTRRETFRAVKQRGSLWYYGSIGYGHDPSSDTGHPATFAEAFALDAVTIWSNPGELVCDTFSGSGTVATACAKLGRRFVGAEIVESYHRRSLERTAAVSLLLPFAEPTEARR